MIIGFELGHDLNLEFSRSNIEFAISQSIRARLGRAAPLGQPRSVHRSKVECSSLSQNDGQMTLKVKVNDPHFQYQLRESQAAYWVQIW